MVRCFAWSVQYFFLRVEHTEAVPECRLDEQWSYICRARPLHRTDDVPWRELEGHAPGRVFNLIWRHIVKLRPPASYIAHEGLNVRIGLQQVVPRFPVAQSSVDVCSFIGIEARGAGKRDEVVAHVTILPAPDDQGRAAIGLDLVALSERAMSMEPNPLVARHVADAFGKRQPDIFNLQRSWSDRVGPLGG